MEQSGEIEQLKTVIRAGTRASQGAQESLDRLLAMRPELTSYEAGLWEDFFTLTSDRSVGIARGPIPVRSMFDYADRYDMDELQTEFMIRALRAMDLVYLEVNASIDDKTPK